MVAHYCHSKIKLVRANSNSSQQNKIQKEIQITPGKLHTQNKNKNKYLNSNFITSSQTQG